MKTLIICFMLMGGCSPAWAWTNEQIADAIYKAEGGEKTAYPYGIKSLKYENRTDRSLSKIEWAKQYQRHQAEKIEKIEKIAVILVVYILVIFAIVFATVFALIRG